jgi:Domain of unknown function (DUF1840)
MLYKFKTAASGDVIMLEATGRQVLEIIGKGPDAKGILLPEQMPAAKAALLAAVERDEALAALTEEEEDQDEGHRGNQRISLRARAWPLVMLIEHSSQANVPITWGV